MADKKSNPFTDALRGASSAINGFNNAVGSGVDAGFDATIGNIIGLVNQDAGNAVKNLDDGSLMSNGISALEDVGLGALAATGIGTIPAASMMVAKNAVENGDLFADAIDEGDPLKGAVLILNIYKSYNIYLICV